MGDGRIGEGGDDLRGVGASAVAEVGKGDRGLGWLRGWVGCVRVIPQPFVQRVGDLGRQLFSGSECPSDALVVPDAGSEGVLPVLVLDCLFQLRRMNRWGHIVMLLEDENGQLGRSGRGPFVFPFGDGCAAGVQRGVRNDLAVVSAALDQDVEIGLLHLELRILQDGAIDGGVVLHGVGCHAQPLDGLGRGLSLGREVEAGAGDHDSVGAAGHGSLPVRVRSVMPGVDARPAAVRFGRPRFLPQRARRMHQGCTKCLCGTGNLCASFVHSWGPLW